MLNPTIFLKKFNQLVPLKKNRKGQKPRHSITLDDNGELCLTVVVNVEKGIYHKIRLDHNSHVDTVVNRNKPEILELVKKYPVK